MIEQLRQAIEEIEHRWSSMRLTVVGDVMLDKYIGEMWGVFRLKHRYLSSGQLTVATNPVERPM